MLFIRLTESKVPPVLANPLLRVMSAALVSTIKLEKSESPKTSLTESPFKVKFSATKFNLGAPLMSTSPNPPLPKF